MTNIMDDLEAIKKLDSGRTLDSLIAFPDQFIQVWKKTQTIKYSPEFRQAQNVVVAGMGGSALGGKIIKSLFENEINVPFEVINDYSLPKFINEKSLVIVVSYSGNTEETLSCLEEAKKRKALLFLITAGGRLSEEIRAGLPGFVFESKFNYLNYPKTAIGYNLGAILGVLSGMGIIGLPSASVESQAINFKEIQKQYLPGIAEMNNPAKTLANFLVGKTVVVVSAAHLKGPGMTFRNQVNELAHSFCCFAELPEMNHHLVEAFINPKGLKQSYAYVFIKSKNYPSRIVLRAQITQEILDKENIPWKEYELKTSQPLAEALETIQLGGFTAFYLSILNQQDPGKEPWIPFIKEKLAAAYEKKK
jgi:glucose/mannose-6-phosphate isomerase